MQLKQLPLWFQFWVVCTNFVLPFFASGVSLSPKRALIFLATCSKNYNAMVNGASDGRGRRGHSGKSVAPRRTRNSSSIVVIFSLAADERTDGRDGETERGRETDREETNVLHRQLQGMASSEIIPFSNARGFSPTKLCQTCLTKTIQKSSKVKRHKNISDLVIPWRPQRRRRP